MYCQKVLRARQKEGNLPSCPISDDVTSYTPAGADMEATVVTAGFPCQACLLFSYFDPTAMSPWRV